MKRGELYLVHYPSKQDTKRQRVFVVASRQDFIDSAYSTVVCAPVYTSYDGLSTQVALGIEEGLKHECALRCDELMSIPKANLTDYVGRLRGGKLLEFDIALSIALGIR
jgi:mRNA interferase MazF